MVKVAGGRLCRSHTPYNDVATIAGNDVPQIRGPREGLVTIPA